MAPTVDSQAPCNTLRLHRRCSIRYVTPDMQNRFSEIRQWSSISDRLTDRLWETPYYEVHSVASRKEQCKLHHAKLDGPDGQSLHTLSWWYHSTESSEPRELVFRQTIRLAKSLANKSEQSGQISTADSFDGNLSGAGTAWLPGAFRYGASPDLPSSVIWTLFSEWYKTLGTSKIVAIRGQLASLCLSASTFHPNSRLY